jgi:hypothetical protein
VGCGSQNASFSQGTSVTLTATPASGYQLAGWQGCDRVSGSQCSVTMNANRTVTATFALASQAAFLMADVAKLPGLCNTFWRTDLRVFNPSAQTLLLHVDVLPVGQNNANPATLPNVAIAPRNTWVVDDFVQYVQDQASTALNKAALRVRFEPGEVAPVVVARTYTNAPGGGTYGQFVPALPTWGTWLSHQQWLTGLRKDSRFRTNVSLYNLQQGAVPKPPWNYMELTASFWLLPARPCRPWARSSSPWPAG